MIEATRQYGRRVFFATDSVAAKHNDFSVVAGQAISVLNFVASFLHTASIVATRPSGIFFIIEATVVGDGLSIFPEQPKYFSIVFGMLTIVSCGSIRSPL